MAIVFFSNTTETIKPVTSIHYQPQLLDDETRALGERLMKMIYHY